MSTNMDSTDNQNYQDPKCDNHWSWIRDSRISKTTIQSTSITSPVLL